MISVDSHSKQIKLLNQYILALQKQVNTTKTELQQLRKSSKFSNEDFNKLNIDISKFKHENEQLKKSMVKANQQLNRFYGIQKEFVAVREYSQRLNSQKNDLIRKIQEITADNHSIYEHMQQLEEQSKKQKDMFEQQFQKANQELQKCKNALLQSQKDRQELGVLLLREKQGANLRILELQGKLKNTANTKNEESMKLNKLLEQSKTKINFLERENMEIKNVLVQFNNLKAQNQRYVKECNDLKIQNDKRNDDNRVLSNVLNSRVKQFETYSNRSNQQKTNLLRIIRSLEQQKNNLEQLNNSFKGSAGENSRALAINMKKLEESQQKNIQFHQEMNILKAQKAQLQNSLMVQKKQFQKLNNQYGKIWKQKQQLLSRQTQTLRLKFNGQLFYNSQINKKDTQIQSLQKQRNELLSQIKNKSKIITLLQQELNSIKLQYSSFKNQFISIKDGQSQEIDIIQTKLKDSERKNNLNLQRIQNLNQMMTELQIKYQNQIRNFENSVMQIQKLKQDHEKQINQIKNEFQHKIKRKNQQMVGHSSQKGELLRKISQLQLKIKQNQEDLLKKQAQNKQKISQIQRQNQIQIEKLKKVTILNSFEAQQFQQKQYQISLLRQNISEFQRTLNEQKTTITSLAQSLSKKSTQIQSLQESNALLRKQIINSITNQQASKKQLVEIKSKAGSTYSKSRVKSTILDNSFSRTSFIQSKFKTTGSKFRSGSGEKNIFNKKRTFNQERVSMIDEIQKRDFDIEPNDQRQTQFNNILQ